MKCIILSFLTLLFIAHDVFGQKDTVDLKFTENALTEHFAIGKHPRDTHVEDYFPFTGPHGYNFKLSDKELPKTISFAFSSHGPEDTGIPFYYQKVKIDDIEELHWLTAASLAKWTNLEIIRYFRNKNKVVMLYDTTQPEGDTQYLVRVYFEFDAWE